MVEMTLPTRVLVQSIFDLKAPYFSTHSLHQLGRKHSTPIEKFDPTLGAAFLWAWKKFKAYFCNLQNVSQLHLCATCLQN